MVIFSMSVLIFCWLVMYVTYAYSMSVFTCSSFVTLLLGGLVISFAWIHVYNSSKGIQENIGFAEVSNCLTVMAHGMVEFTHYWSVAPFCLVKPLSNFSHLPFG
jgi:hypothetical protein